MSPGMNAQEGGYVYAIFADGRAHRLSSRNDAPDDARVFESYENMALLSTQELDAITMRLLKAQTLASRSHEEALDRAWNATLAAAIALEDATSTVSTPSQKSRKVRATRPVKKQKCYALNYDFSNPDSTKESVLKALPPQAQTCLQIFAMSGKSSLFEFEIKGLFEANQALLKTSQAPWRIFMYYRKPLREKGFLIFDDDGAVPPVVESIVE